MADLDIFKIRYQIKNKLKIFLIILKPIYE